MGVLKAIALPVSPSLLSGQERERDVVSQREANRPGRLKKIEWIF